MESNIKIETTNLAEQKGFTFTLIIKPYIRKNCAMDDIRVIYSDKTCLVAKNSKFGGLYIHPTGKIIKGRFVKFAGSNRYPILIAEKEVHIRFENFPSKPNIITDQYKTQDIITLLMDS
jgi:hypothetical protein